MSSVFKPVTSLDRRDFVKLGAVAGGGLLLGVRFSTRGEAEAAGVFQPNAFLQVAPDGGVTLWVSRSDMGQGVRTALPMIVADELDADWDRVSIEQADAHPDRYGSMMTVGSSSVRGGAWMRLREAGASAREMLVAAAAARWGVAAGTCRTEKGRVLHDASSRALGYGELAEEAAALPLPSRPRLKDPSEFRLIGTPLPMLDSPAKVTGQAGFGIDARVPGMLFATVLRPPVFGGSLASFDPTPALAVPGVRRVVEISSGVAVVAENTWAAFKGAQALKVVWDQGDFSMDSEDIFRRFAELAEHGSATEAESRGDARAALASASRRVESTYRAPYLAHATMEPMNCTADVRPDRCVLWAPTQNPQGTQSVAARLTGLSPEAVTVHVTFMGCGWGRRARTDFVEDAVETSMKVGAPVQVLWTREEDMRQDHYRPAAHHNLVGGLDAGGRLSGLSVRIVAPPIAGGRGRVDGPAVAAIAGTPYRIPDFLVDYVRPDVPVPVSYWRSVGPSQNTFIFESFIDELADAAGRDPVDFRLDLLEEAPRLKHVLEVARERSGWGTPPAAGRARGVALVEDTGTRVAQVAEVSLDGGRVRVHRVTCVADCGQVVHPGVVEGQMVGAIVGGLSAALYGEITIQEGRVVQGNFDDYPMLRIDGMPEVDVHLIPSHDEPTGAGEPGLPPIAPAVANALFALTGKRVRRLPIRVEELANDGA